MPLHAQVKWTDSDFFANLESNQALGELGTHVTERAFSPKEHIFDEGDEARDVYILKSGQVELTYVLPTHPDTAVRITVVRPGEVFAWSGLMMNSTGSPTLTANANALEECEAYTIPAERLRQVMDSHPSFGYKLMSRLANLIAGRLRDTRTQLQWLNSGICISAPPIAGLPSNRGSPSG